MVPVLVCTRTRLDTKSVFLQRGQVMRKEGEKRRKKTGPRFLLSTLFIQNKLTYVAFPSTFSSLQDDDQGSNRRRNNPEESGVSKTSWDTWKISSTSMNKETVTDRSLERSYWKLQERKIQAASLEGNRKLLYLIKIGIICSIIVISQTFFSFILEFSQHLLIFICIV